MEKHNLKHAILAAIENGDRLLADAKSMLDWERFPTSYALAVLAQEEYAKALLLSLIDADAIPLPRLEITPPVIKINFVFVFSIELE